MCSLHTELTCGQIGGEVFEIMCLRLVVSHSWEHPAQRASDVFQLHQTVSNV